MNQTPEFIGYNNIKRYDLRQEGCLDLIGNSETNNLEWMKKQKRYMEKVTKMKYYIYDRINNTIVDVDKPRRKKRKTVN